MRPFGCLARLPLAPRGDVHSDGSLGPGHSGGKPTGLHGSELTLALLGAFPVVLGPRMVSPDFKGRFGK